MIKPPPFKEKKCSYLFNNFVCWGCATSQTPQLYLKKNSTCLPTSSYAWILSNMQKCSLNLWSIQILFTSGISPDILINMFEDCIVFIIWAAWAVFNFFLTQKQRFLVWSFSENVSFISFHGGIWSRYLEINKFKSSKCFSFQK